MPTPLDPLADLKAEIAAEAAAAEAAVAPSADEPMEPGEPVTEEELAAQEATTQAAEAAAIEAAEVAAAAAEEKPKAKRKAKEPPAAEEERMVPAERLNEYAVRTRKTEKELEETRAQLEALKNPKPPVQPRQMTVEEVEARAYARAARDFQVNEFLKAGYKAFGRQEFDEGCNKIAALIAGEHDLIIAAIEATDGVDPAARAIRALYAMDAPEIEAFLRLPERRQAARLEVLANTRTRASASPSTAGEKTRRLNIEEDSEPPAPIRPIMPNNRVAEGLGDDVPADVWFDRFEKQVMKPRH